MPEPTPDTELTLTHGPYALTVSPYGASLRGLTHDTEPVITGYHGEGGKVGGQGDVLIPFPGRVANGRYTFEGQTYQMPLNDKESPSAIHGFLRTQMWQAKEGAVDDSVIFHTELVPDQHPGYPFALSVAVTYALSDAGLTVSFTIENIGDGPAPVAAGFHPYFTAGSDHIDADTLHLPFDSYLEYDGLLPTGKVLSVDGSPYDFRQPRPIEGTAFNTCFAAPRRDVDGLCRIRLAAPGDARTRTVWLDSSLDYVVLYSGDPLPESHRRRSLAIEPMTCGSDAFNHPEWGLVALAPAQALTGSWGVTTE
ncbi:MAG: hypothetical protein JO250_07185 [Armatimonadetes bacterium]|nr:hypothetical protein [Armatimonadota bacterium]